jgi:hypothetical protein
MKAAQAKRSPHHTAPLPVYILQGNYGCARQFNSVCDVTGSYVGRPGPRDAAMPGGYDGDGAASLSLLDCVEGQTAPVSVIEINHGIGMGYEATLTAALMAGGRATGFWMDGDAATAASHPDWPGPIETQPWWNASAEILQRAEAVWKNRTVSAAKAV